MKYLCDYIVHRGGVAVRCGSDLIATDESVPANAEMAFDDSTDSYAYTGHTDVCWDGQTTNVGENGRVLVICEDGHVTEAPEGFEVA